jgi:hypothetical protein
MDLTKAILEEYLSQIHKQPVQVLELQDLSARKSGTSDTDGADGSPLKVFGYGRPILIRYRLGDCEQHVVLRTATANQFGHENRADRAADLLLSFDTYNTLPRHVAALDVGVFHLDEPQPAQKAAPAQAHMRSLGKAKEFFLVTPYVEGKPYAVDLQQLRDGKELHKRDLLRARQLALYLVQIHAKKYPDSGTNGLPSQSILNRAVLYRRRIRDTIGSGEGIMGLIDSYPADYPLATPEWLEEVEKACIAWRWRLKTRDHRLCQVHGDYHPFNLVFSDDNGFALLDRSRGAWGEPADDVSCLAINYLFFSLQRSGRMEPPFRQLWDSFWQTYLEHTDDHELFNVVVPFLIWRALVLANPIWYDTPISVRQTIFRFIERILSLKSFDPDCINEYCGV